MNDNILLHNNIHVLPCRLRTCTLQTNTVACRLFLEKRACAFVNYNIIYICIYILRPRGLFNLAPLPTGGYPVAQLQR